MRLPLTCLLSAVVAVLSLAVSAQADERWVTYEGKEGPGQGKHILFIAGDEEYRSEEACPTLAQILAKHHGFRCTVLFSQDPETGEIDPGNQTHIPGMHLIPSADLIVLFTRFRELPDEDMKYFDDYFRSGKPIIGLRTATHGFNYSRNKQSPYRKYTWTHKGPEWQGGFGKEVFGETWYNHHGKHKHESTRGVLNPDASSHPILNGVEDLWGPTDVYGIRELPEGSTPLVYGQVLEGMEPDDEPVAGKKNDPMMPVAWTRQYQQPTGEKNRVFCTTFCSAIDLKSEDLRRMIVNACFWALEMEDQIPEEADVSLVQEYEPSFYGFGSFKKGVKPSDWAW